MILRLALLLLCLGSAARLAAQTPLSGIVNVYGRVTAVDYCTNTLTLSNAAGFVVGQGVIVIQMQGATINTNDSPAFGDLVGLGGAGQYEYNEIAAIDGTVLTLAYQLQGPYTLSGRVQCVGFARPEVAAVVDTVRAQPWNGFTGGVIALEATDTLHLTAPVVATGTGFRGGAPDFGPDNNCSFLTFSSRYYYEPADWRGSPKGEGIALPTPGREWGRGAQANGGGGGNNHNSGGGGGANGGGGGRGGENNEPSFGGCDGFYPGEGGKTTAWTPTQLVAGGGGGAGHRNNPNPNAGGAGGGIVILRAPVVVFAGAGAVVANGQSAAQVQGDGGGGGGAGGALVLDAGEVLGAPLWQARGGAGGHNQNNNQARCMGPGGGGGGGRMLTTVPQPADLAGGTAGLTLNSASCPDGTNGALNGQPGATQTIGGLVQGEPTTAPAIVATTPDTLHCAGQSLALGAVVEGSQLNFQWQFDTGSGFANVPNGPLFAGALTDTLRLQPGAPAAAYRLLVSSAGCSQPLVAGPIQVDFLPAPTANFTWTTDQLTLTTTNLSTFADGLRWDFGDGATSTLANPTHTYATGGAYTVSLTAYNRCDTVTFSQEINLGQAPPSAAFQVNPGEGCAPHLVQLQNLSTGQDVVYTWLFPGGAPTSSSLLNPSVVYDQAGLYPITLIAANAAGADTFTLATAVSVAPAPDATFGFVVNGFNVSFQAGGPAADLYTWSFGAGQTATGPMASFTFPGPGIYPVTLTAANACGEVTATQTLSLGQPPQAGIQTTVLVGCAAPSGLVRFVNTTTGDFDSQSWTFPGGDPATSTAAEVPVTYALPGLYTATLTVDGPLGNSTTSINVEIFSAPSPAFTYEIDGLTVRCTNLSTQADTYSWAFGDGATSSAVNPQHTYAAPGVYDLTLNAQNAACGQAITQRISVGITAAQEAAAAAGIRVYPNPVDTWLTIQIPQGGGRAELYQPDGQLLAQWPLTLATTTVEWPAACPAGSYLLRLWIEGKMWWWTVVKAK